MFNAVMHIAFYTDRMEEMLDFYTGKLGLPIKVLTRFKAYANSERPAMRKAALEEPERIFYVYIELAPGQFLELFPRLPGQVEHKVPWNSELGYSHFALTCDDIFATRAQLEKAGIEFDTEISKGPSNTYQMWAHDPDGNKFEIMQYTADSYQVVGHID